MQPQGLCDRSRVELVGFHMPEIKIKQNVRAENNRIAAEFRDKCSRQGTLVVDVMGTVGAGKTMVLEEIARMLPPDKKGTMAVVNGDLATTIDSDRISSYGVATTQINTGRGCHLNAIQVQKALKNLDIDGLEYLFVENVGNTICPAGWDIGAHLRVVVTSTTEGPYVVEKHPFTFKSADIILFNKMDLAEAMEVDEEKLYQDATKMAPDAKVLFATARAAKGISELLELLEQMRESVKSGSILEEAHS